MEYGPKEFIRLVEILILIFFCNFNWFYMYRIFLK